MQQETEGIPYQVTILTGDRPLRKKYIWQFQKWNKVDTEKAYKFDVKTATVRTIDQLHDLLDALRHEPYDCVVRGALEIDQEKDICRTLCRQPGDGGNFSSRARYWACIDIDAPGNGAAAQIIADPAGFAESIWATLPGWLTCSSAVWQISNSGGIADKIAVHYWVMFDKPIATERLRDLYRSLSDIGVDASLSTPNQIHFTADPEIEGACDPVPQRIGIIRGSSDTVSLDSAMSSIPERPPAKPTQLRPANTYSHRDVSKPARDWMERQEPAVSGQGGHSAALKVARGLIWGWALPYDTALQIMSEYNARCSPPWSDAEMAHKLKTAADPGGAPYDYGAFVAEREEYFEKKRAPSAEDGPPIECLTIPPEMLEAGAGRAKKGDGGDRKLRNAELIDLFRSWPIKYNQLSGFVEYEGAPIKDLDITYMQLSANGIRASKISAIDALLYVAKKERCYDPLIDDLERCAKLEPLPVNMLATEYLRCDDKPCGYATVYDRMIEVAIIGAVKRAYEPGCQFDTATILVGSQGVGKSTFWHVLAGDRFFCDSVSDITNKDALMQLHASWIVELGELDHLTNKSHVGQIKSFLSCRVDSFRPPYGKGVEVYPRRCAIVGSTNDSSGCLRDDTGSRRFLLVPVTVPAIDVAQLAENRDRLISGAIAAYRAGVQTWLNKDDQATSEKLNEDARGDHPWEEAVLEYASTQIARFTTESVLASLGIDTGRMTPRDAAIVSGILRRAGFVQSRSTVNGRKTRIWTGPLDH